MSNTVQPVQLIFIVTNFFFKNFDISINTVYYMAPFATMILAVPALLLEGAGVIAWIQTSPNLLSSFIIIIGSGVMAFCLNFSIFYVIHSTTAVTFNVAGNLKVLSYLQSTSHFSFRRKRTQFLNLCIIASYFHLNNNICYNCIIVFIFFFCKGGICSCIFMDDI